MKKKLIILILILFAITIVFGVIYLNLFIRRTVNYKLIYKPCVEKTVYDILLKESLI